MQPLLFILLPILNLNYLPFHDYHATVFDIEYKIEKKTLQLTTKVFIDDFESYLKKKELLDFDIDNPSNAGKIDVLFDQYLSKHWAIINQNRPLKSTLLGHETKYDLFQFYVEYQLPEKPKSLDFQCSFFLNLYEDQINIMFLRYQDKEYNLRFDFEERTGQIKLSNS